MAMEFVFVKNTFLEVVSITEERTRSRSTPCSVARLRTNDAARGLVLTEPPRVTNTVLDVDEDMELSISWSRQGCTSGREPFMVDMSVPSDRIEASSKSITEDTAAEEQNQTNKKRPSKGKRDRYNKLIQRLQTRISENPEGFTLDEVVLPPSLQANGKQRLKLIEQMERYQHAVLTSIGG